MKTNLFEFLGGSVDNIINSFINPAATALIATLSTLAITCLSLYFVLMGYMIMTGAVQESFYTLLKQCLKAVLISAIALNADNYLHWIVEGFRGLQSGIASALNTTNDLNVSIYKVLDDSFNKGLEVTAQCFKTAHDSGFIASINWGVSGLLVGFGTCVITVSGAITIFVAQFSLAVMFAIGPLFIMCLMWPMTARFFDAWFSQVINYVLTVAMVAIVMMFAMKCFDLFVSNGNFDGAGEANPLLAAFSIFALTVIKSFIIKETAGMASALAGGVSMAALGIRHFANPAKNALGKAYQSINPTSTRRDLATNAPTTNSRFGHIREGNTNLNPAYSRRTFDNIKSSVGNIKRNWSLGK